jgi:hypothetical protein
MRDERARRPSGRCVATAARIRLSSRQFFESRSWFGATLEPGSGKTFRNCARAIRPIIRRSSSVAFSVGRNAKMRPGSTDPMRLVEAGLVLDYSSSLKAAAA